MGVSPVTPLPFAALATFFPDATMHVLVREGSVLTRHPVGARTWAPGEVFSLIVEDMEMIAPAPQVIGWQQRILHDGSVRYDRVL